MSNLEFITKAKEWINSLIGSAFQIYGDLTEEELVTIGKNRFEIENKKGCY